ncbi:MAG: hypothetical protein KAS23_16885 [Anaerohalosphaera sp.]|nr:hypothetical protein [Anaerohalosphaera sp.]
MPLQYSAWVYIGEGCNASSDCSYQQVINNDTRGHLAVEKTCHNSTIVQKKGWQFIDVAENYAKICGFKNVIRL